MKKKHILGIVLSAAMLGATLLPVMAEALPEETNVSVAEQATTESTENSADSTSTEAEEKSNADKIHDVYNELYNTLSGKKLDSEEIAKQLSDALAEVGINNYVVSGTLNGEPHSWNMVEMDGAYYYADLASEAAKEKEFTKLMMGANSAVGYVIDENTADELNIGTENLSIDREVWLTLTFDLNGGSGSLSHQAVPYGRSWQLIGDQPTAPYVTIYFDANGGSVSQTSKQLNYEFKGWNGNDGNHYDSGCWYTFWGNLTLTAQWDDPCPGDMPTPVRDGFTFQGWWTAREGGEEITCGCRYNHDGTAYAHWKSTNNTITYNPNGGNGTQFSDTKLPNATIYLRGMNTYYKNFTVYLDATGGNLNGSPATSSYTQSMTSWNTAANGSGSYYPCGSAYSYNSNLTLYAQWGLVTVNLPIPTRTLNGQNISFIGWFDAPYGGNQYANVSQLGNDIKLYAHWDTSALIRQFVTRMYTVCLGRTPDQGGLDYWCNNLQQHTMTGKDVAYGFVFSQEVQNMHLSNDAYLVMLYHSFFDREPDQSGYSYWLNILNSTNNRYFVLQGFVNSQEFTNLCNAYGIERGTL